MKDYTIKTVQAYEFRRTLYDSKQEAIEARNKDLESEYHLMCIDLYTNAPFDKVAPKGSILEIARIIEALETDGIEEPETQPASQGDEVPHNAAYRITWPDKCPVICWDDNVEAVRQVRFWDASTQRTFDSDGCRDSFDWENITPISEAVAAQLFGGARDL